jgi:hypothetical protein
MGNGLEVDLIVVVECISQALFCSGRGKKKQSRI